MPKNRTPEYYDRNRALQQARDKKRREKDRKAREVERRRELAAARAAAMPAIRLYRETKAARMPAIKRREAEVIRVVKAAVKEADRRAEEMRTRGRPKKKGLNPLFIRSSADALVAAVSEWHGER